MEPSQGAVGSGEISGPGSLQDLLDAYDPSAPLARARTIPSAWYTDPRIHALEQRGVLGGNWHLAARVDQLAQPGRYVTTRIGGNPVALVRGGDGMLRAFFNTCRHHGAEVLTEPEGSARLLRCPYHAWTYSLEGELRGVPEFDGVEDFDRKQNGLLPVRVAEWERFVFVDVSGCAPPLKEHLDGVAERVAPLELGKLHWYARRSYEVACNWKVYVDNYLDGGYHVPFLHRQLSGVLESGTYTIETERCACLQWSVLSGGGGGEASTVRRGERAFYWWIHPNFMLNWYEGVLDTNVVVPLAPDRCLVVFDFWFEDVSAETDARNRRSIDVAERVQEEDRAVCESVQRGLGSRAYDTGRLSVRREAGEHLFHRLLHADLVRALGERLV